MVSVTRVIVQRRARRRIAATIISTGLRFVPCGRPMESSMPRSIASHAAALAIVVLVTGVVLAERDLRIGQWKNTKDPHNILTYSAAGDGLKTEVENLAPTGDKTIWFYTTMLDGSDAVITGGGSRHFAAVTKVDDYTNEIVYKAKDGRVLQLATNVVSKDRKTLTVTFRTREGKQTAVLVYERVR